MIRRHHGTWPNAWLSRETGDELYDLAHGPGPPKTRGPCPGGEWDDPTWLRAVVDETWMAVENERVDMKARQAAIRSAAAYQRRKQEQGPWLIRSVGRGYWAGNGWVGAPAGAVRYNFKTLAYLKVGALTDVTRLRDIVIERADEGADVECP